MHIASYRPSLTRLPKLLAARGCVFEDLWGTESLCTRQEGAARREKYQETFRRGHKPETPSQSNRGSRRGSRSSLPVLNSASEDSCYRSLERDHWALRARKRNCIGEWSCSEQRRVRLAQVILIMKMWKNILCHSEALQGVGDRIRQSGNAKVSDGSGNVRGDQGRGACHDLETVRDKGRILVEFCVEIGVVLFILIKIVRDGLETL